MEALYTILENKANTNVRFTYLIFNPDYDTDFSNLYILKFKSKIMEDYKETLEEISIFGDFKWLFDAVMNYQAKHLGLSKPQFNFEFALLDQRSYV